jgi:hypothetical protein
MLKKKHSYPTVNIKTLDAKHTHKLDEFSAKSNAYQDKMKALELIEASLERYGSNALSNLSDEQFNDYMGLQDKHKDLMKEIQTIKANRDELDYYVTTGDIIFKYYEIVEKGNENDALHSVKENSILKFFVQASASNTMPEHASSIPEGDRAGLLDRYLQYTDENYMKPNPIEDSNRCSCCDSENRTPLVNDGFMYCNDCHSIETLLVDHEKPSYKDPPKEISYFALIVGQKSRRFKPLTRLVVMIVNIIVTIELQHPLMLENSSSLQHQGGCESNHWQRANSGMVIA